MGCRVKVYTQTVLTAWQSMIVDLCRALG